MVPPFCECQNGTPILEGRQASPTPLNFFRQEDYFNLCSETSNTNLKNISLLLVLSLSAPVLLVPYVFGVPVG